MQKQATVSLRVSTTQHRDIAAAARRDDLSVSEWVREALELSSKRPLSDWTAMDVVAGTRPNRRVP